MKIQVYVEKAVSAEQQEWAQRLRAKGHRVHFCLDKPFRKCEEVDVYVSDNEVIVAAYKALDIPPFDDSMLSDAEKPPKKKRGRPAKAKEPEVNHADNVEAGIEEAVDKNTGGTGVIQEPNEAA